MIRGRSVFVSCLYCDWQRELEDTWYHFEDGVRELWKESHPVVSDVRCVECSKPAIFSRELDRFLHIDGSDNRRCWTETTSGRADWKIKNYHVTKESLT